MNKNLTPEEERMFMAGWLSRHIHGEAANKTNYECDKQELERRRDLVPETVFDLYQKVLMP